MGRKHISTEINQNLIESNLNQSFDIINDIVSNRIVSRISREFAEGANTDTLRLCRGAPGSCGSFDSSRSERGRSGSRRKHPSPRGHENEAHSHSSIIVKSRGEHRIDRRSK